MIYPNHIGFIPDGNRTRAQHQGFPEGVGYMNGMRVGLEITRHILYNTPVEVVTGWFLSTENVKERSESSLNEIVNLASSMLDGLDDDLHTTQTNFVWIGNPHGLPEQFVSYLNQKAKKFSSGGRKTICFAINYGGRDEIIRAIHRATSAGVSMDTIDDKTLSAYMDMANLPPLDLVIRTKGDYASRTSGFASWHIGYAELAFSPKLCPDFTLQDFENILLWYDSVSHHKNFGK